MDVAQSGTLELVIMEPEVQESVDPRVRRTRLMFQHALDKLLQSNDFETISVQHIAAAATLNRATFYDHYPDKYALLACMVGSRFHELLSQREVRFEHGCTTALQALVRAVFEYLTRLRGPEATRALEPHMEQSILDVVRTILLQGLKKHPPSQHVPTDLIAASLGGAIYGTVREWTQTPGRGTVEQLIDNVAILVTPTLRLIYDPDLEP